MEYLREETYNGRINQGLIIFIFFQVLCYADRKYYVTDAEHVQFTRSSEAQNLFFFFFETNLFTLFSPHGKYPRFECTACVSVYVRVKTCENIKRKTKTKIEGGTTTPNAHEEKLRIYISRIYIIMCTHKWTTHIPLRIGDL